MKLALTIESLLHKEVKKPKESTVITWYFLFMCLYILAYFAAIGYLLLVVLRREPAHPREILIPVGVIGYTHKKVKAFHNKIFPRR